MTQGTQRSEANGSCPGVNLEKRVDVKILKVGMNVYMKGKEEAVPDTFLVAKRAAMNWQPYLMHSCYQPVIVLP
jgi:hypothetical protein